MDRQADGPQAVTVEDSFSIVHASHGQLEPLSPLMRSEPAIIAGIAAATLGRHPVDSAWLVEDYTRVRQLIAATISGFFAQIPDVGQMLIAIAGNERLLAAICLVDRTLNGADVAAVDMNANRNTIAEGIADLMDIADGR